MNYTRSIFRSRASIWLSVLIFIFLLKMPFVAGAFTNIITQTGPAEVTIHYPASPNSYYTFYSASNSPPPWTNVLRVHRAGPNELRWNGFWPEGNQSNSLWKYWQPEAMALGTNDWGSFRVSIADESCRFFDIERTELPIGLDNSSAWDHDGDGIDDYYELTHPPLKPLNPADADPYLAQYRSSLPLFAFFQSGFSSASAWAQDVNVPFYLTKPFAGTVRYQVSGTTVAGKDFQPLTGTVAVNGTNGYIPISLIKSPQIQSARSIVIALQMETNKGPYTLSKPTAQRLDLIQGDAGVYFGAMSATNGVLIGPQSLTVAVRSGDGNTGTAYFDTTGCTFFTQPFTMNVQFLGTNSQFKFSAPATGTTQLTNLGRTLNWSLAFTDTLFTNSIVQAPFSLSVQGIISGTETLVLKGNMILGPVGR